MGGAAMLSNVTGAELARRFQRLLTTYSELRSSGELHLKGVVEWLLPAFRDARKKWAEGQRQVADDFNLLAVIGVEGDEVRHSKILAWLLDRRIEHGTHAQGNLGFRLFLEEFGPDLEEPGDRHVAAYAD